MERRPLGRTGHEVGALGLGGEHFEPDRRAIDAVLGAAADAGMNYLDAVFPNPLTHNAAYWEELAPALRPHRERFLVTAHWGRAPSIEEARREFEAVLERLGGRADGAMLQIIDDQWSWDNWVLRSLDALEDLRADGRVGYVGISGHSPAIQLVAAESGMVDVQMVGLSLLTHLDTVLPRVVAACRAAGVGLIAMKPFHGGRLLSRGGKPTGITPVQCLAYTLAQDVSMALVGVRDVDQLRESLRYLEAGAEERDFSAARAGLPETFAGLCTYCNHCMPCPQGLDIGQTILRADVGEMGQIDDGIRAWYAALAVPASACVACGECLSRCPFGVDVPARMRAAVELYEAAP